MASVLASVTPRCCCDACSLLFCNARAPVEMEKGAASAEGVGRWVVGIIGRKGEDLEESQFERTPNLERIYEGLGGDPGKSNPTLLLSLPK